MIHYWKTRAMCGECGYIWTNPGSGSIICLCGGAHIANDVIIAGDQVESDSDFNDAVADCLGLRDVEVVRWQ